MKKLVVLLGVVALNAHAGAGSSGFLFSDSKTLPSQTSETAEQILSEIPANLSDLSGPAYDFDGAEFDPSAPGADEALRAFDQAVESTTGQSTRIDGQNVESPWADLIEKAGGCYQLSCPVFAHVSRSHQSLTLYINGEHTATWAVSTGTGGRPTPYLNKHPTGRVYDAYTSTKFPGGNYNGLGNMPYAVFIAGGIAIHGTPRGNWGRLGSRASHGCIRVHPEHGRAFNRLVRSYGPGNVWVLVD